MGAPTEEANDALNFVEELARSPSDRLLSDRTISASDIAAYFHTGGTTGSPKLAQHTHGNQIYTAQAIGALLSTQPDDVVINGMPLFHVAGSLDCSLGFFATGGTVLMPTAAGARNPEVIANYWKIVEHFRVTVVGGIPTTVGAVANVPINNADISSVRFAVTGGASTPVETSRRLEALTAVKLHQIYGMTEAAGIIAVDPRLGPRRLGSAGLRTPYEKMRVARQERDGSPGADCAANETGVILVKGPQVSPGYKEVDITLTLL